MTDPKPRPVDIDTACWLWLAAVPLMVASYLAAGIGAWQQLAPKVGGTLSMVVAINAFISFMLASLAITGIFLMRLGYRLARTLLTGGAIGSVLFVALRLFDLDGSVAVVQAMTGITAAVLICGGLFLCHREDATAYLTR